MLTKQQMSVARKVYGRCYCRRCATSGKIAGGSERFVKGVYAGIFCSECWALDERSGNTPNGSVLLNGPLTAEAERPTQTNQPLNQNAATSCANTARRASRWIGTCFWHADRTQNEHQDENSECGHS